MRMHSLRTARALISITAQSTASGTLHLEQRADRQDQAKDSRARESCNDQKIVFDV